MTAAEEQLAFDKTVQASTLQECIAKEISHQAHKHPDQEQKQNIAIAHKKCGERFGASKAELVFGLEKNTCLDGELLSSILEPLKKSMTRNDLIEYATLRKLEGAGNLELAKQLPYTPSWFKKYVDPERKKATELFSGSLSTAQEDTSGGIPPEHLGKHIHTIFDFQISDLQKEARIFEGWGSVEVKDSQKDKLPTDALEKIMPTYMKRGAVIMFGHSNRHVGNILKFEFKPKEVDGKQIPALWLKGQIFNDYKIDDEAWEAIKLAQQSGKPVLSLGATPIGAPKYACDETECFRKFDELQLFEFTVTDMKRGQQGANPEATIEMAKAESEQSPESFTLEQAKADLEKAEVEALLPELSKLSWNIDVSECEKMGKRKPKELCRGIVRNHKMSGYNRGKPEHERQKRCENDARYNADDLCQILATKGLISNKRTTRSPYAQYRDYKPYTGKSDESKLDYYWIGGRMLKMKEDGTLPESGDELVDLMLSTCGSCQDRYSELKKAGSTDQEARQALLKELTENLNEMEKDVREMSDETETDETVNKDNEIVLAIQEMAKALSEGQANIVKLLSKEEPPAPPKAEDEEEEEEEEEPEVKAEDEEEDAKPALTLAEQLAKKGITEDELKGLVKASGWQIIEGSPAPSLDPSRGLTKGDQADAQEAASVEKDIEAMQRGTITELEQ